MSKIDMAKIGRLAMRVEGNNWVAYYAMPGSMEGALFLGSMAMALTVRQERKDEFMGLMRECVGDLIEHAFGERPQWPEGAHPAPESERSGNA